MQDEGGPQPELTLGQHSLSCSCLWYTCANAYRNLCKEGSPQRPYTLYSTVFR